MRVRWTSDAADDLERISDYIAEHQRATVHEGRLAARSRR
jgi:plasmid stabilization system protein ParE